VIDAEHPNPGSPTLLRESGDRRRGGRTRQGGEGWEVAGDELGGYGSGYARKNRGLLTGLEGAVIKELLLRFNANVSRATFGIL
jgi:hypothetical protein